MNVCAHLKINAALLLTCLLLAAGCSDDSTGQKPASDAALQEDAAALSDATDATDTPDDGSSDAAPKDTGSDDASAQDVGQEDAGGEDADSQDTGAVDTGAQDVGSQDTGSQDTGLQDTGSQDTGSDAGLGCTPGDTKQVDCNTCSCNQQGVWACTLLACPPDPYDPCEGKSCGETCTLCDPADPNCNETAVVKYCDDQGNCSAQNSPQCSI